MPSHNDAIEVSILPEEQRQQFRLLELPPELVEILASENAPSLQLKALGRSVSDDADGETVLCTANKTYNIRQVNTSNSVYICLPTADAGDDGLGPPRLHAIADSTFTLELAPAKTPSAMPYLTTLLPVYSSIGTYQSKELLSRRDLFDNVPLSHAECLAAWDRLACFELEDPAGCFLPSGSARLQAWRSILTKAVASGVDLTKPFDQAKVGLIIDSSEDWPQELSSAVLRAVSADATDLQTVAIDQTQCVPFVGISTLIAAKESRRTLPVAKFKQEWKDLLPEAWRDKATVDILPKTEYTIDGDNISYADAYAQGAATARASDAKPSLGAKRKWHEKFRASKRAG